MGWFKLRMSSEAVEIVRSYNEGHLRVDLVPLIREFAERHDPAEDHDFEAWIQEHPLNRSLHPEIEWDVSAGGMFRTYRGLKALGEFWVEWVENWESYIVESIEYRDLGEDWVLTPVEVKAQGRNTGVSVQMRVFEVWQVRDGKIILMKACLSEAEALETARSRPATAE